MGGKYSKVVNPYFPGLKVLEGIDIAVIKAKVSSVSRTMHKIGIYFLTKNDIAWAIDTLDEIHLYQIVSSFDVAQNGHIPSLDFWGAIAMLSGDSNDDKISFCFKMMDLNNDEHLCYNDLVTAMICVTRGVAKLRGYAIMPTEYLEKMALEAFRLCKKTLNEDGEIGLLDLRAVLMSNDLVAQYMANLGVPVVEVDAAALVTKRSNLLKEAIALRAKIAETLCAIEECTEEKEQRASERGGDVELLRVTDSEVVQSRQLHAQALEVERRRKLVEKDMDPDASDNSSVAAVAVVPSFALPNDVTTSKHRRSPAKSAAMSTSKAAIRLASAVLAARPVAADPEHPSRKFLKCDNSVFADMDMTADKKSVKGMYGSSFRTALLEVWQKLPQDQDLMAELDAYTVIALFDNVMVTLSYDAAQHCLGFIPRSTIGRYCFDDVLHWYLLYGADLAVKEVKVTAAPSSDALMVAGSAKASYSPTVSGIKPPNDWTRFADRCYLEYRRYGALLQEVLSKSAYQRIVLDRIDQLVPGRVLKYPNYLHPERAAVTSTPASPNRTGAGGPSGAKEMSYMMKLVEFRKLTSRKPSTIQFKYVFNRPNVTLLPKSAGDGFSSDPNSRGGTGDRGRSLSRGSAGARSGSRSRSRGKSPGSRLGSRAQSQPSGANEDGRDTAETRLNTTSNTSQGQRPTSGPHNPYTVEAERLPPTKTIKLEDIEEWKLKFKLNFTANPFSNMATKRPKESTRVRNTGGRSYIEDFSNLQAQDLLDYFNLLQERLLEEELNREAAEVEAAVAAGIPRPQRHRVKREAKVFNTVTWVCLQLRRDVTPEQEELFSTCIRNFFLTIPYHLREGLFTEVLAKVFTVFLTTADLPKKTEKVVGKFLSSLTGTAEDTAQADAHFLAAPKVMLVALYHEADHFLDVEKQLLSSDIFLTRAVSAATLDVQLMQSFTDLMEHADQFVLYGEKLFGPQEVDMGEENMNPIKFAKDVRAKRRRYEELMQTVGNMSRAELAQHLREMGLKDTGTVAEMAKRASEGFELAAELTGYGELSQFGEDVVARIFHMFKVHPIAKSDEDGGLTLWEFNKLLYHIDAPTMYDAAEYQRLMKELQLLVDRDQRLRLVGLQAYYRNSGRLKDENDKLGVGSLDEKLSGKFFFSCNFEPEALTSVFNLMGGNSLFIPEIVKQLTMWATVRDVKLDAELDKLSEFFRLFDLPAGRQFNRQVLRNPGWLSRAFNSFSAYLSDGEEGILPALRAHLRENFNNYDVWENAFKEEFMVSVQIGRDSHESVAELRALWAKQDRRLARKAQREEEAAEFQRRQQQIADGGSVGSRSTQSKLLQTASEAGSQVGSTVTSPRGSLASYSATGGGGEERPEGDDEEEEDAEEEDFEVVDYASQVQELLEEDLRRVIADMLPPLRSNTTDMPQAILQLKEDLIFLYRMRSDAADVELSLEESNAIFARKQLLLQKIEEAQRMAKENGSLLAAHSCALYDAVRLFTVGISGAGVGTKDCCLRGWAEGLDVSQYLPKGLGELAPVKQQYVEKVEKARQRKASALAALERERRRRNMTEEEKEELRREQHVKQLRVWAKEEAAMFTRAYSDLCHAREERKSMTEIAEMVGRWEALVAVKEQRYPEDLATAVCQNALACIVLEFFGFGHPRGARTCFILLFCLMGD